MSEYHNGIGEGTYKILCLLYETRILKEKGNCPRHIQVRFSADHINAIDLLDDGSLVFEFEWGRQAMKAEDLSLCELDEAIKFLEVSNDVFFSSKMTDCAKYLTEEEFEILQGLHKKVLILKESNQKNKKLCSW